ncbi:MAG: AMP-binding protein [Gammaproteobacteria bacterium]
MQRNLGDTLRGGTSETALIDLADAGRRYTFDELQALTAEAAAAIGFERGQRVGVLGANSAAFVATLLGVMRGGAVAVPMNTRFPDETLAYICRDAALIAAYVDADNQGRLASICRRSTITGRT